MNNNFGNKVRDLRQEKGFSIREFVEDINKKFNVKISKSMVCRWETNLNLPDVDNLILLAKYYNVDIYYLCGLKKDDIHLTEILNENDKPNHFKKMLKEININLDELRLKDLEKIKKMINYFSEKGFDKIDKFLDLIS